jgi:metal-sulfur cluster biosynthetic enzyme
MVTQEAVMDALKQVFDPEIPVNIVDLGLVYKVDVKEEGVVNVLMTLTTPGCGMGGFIAADARARVEEVDGVKEANVEITFEPPWEPSLMSEEAVRMLGGPVD